ncbi:unnamed protein product [Nippostrongylus brasiliensis]|uniref:WW domain-containing protein n=1 Tax=Nippostrongylus brasiliensis TaxID=27835 RepID=A0A0N4XNN1_NIPBR|nr:unnamed protein product [Nippostrongylus brasiliensis]
MGDLSRIRNGGDAVLYEEFQVRSISSLPPNWSFLRDS